MSVQILTIQDLIETNKPVREQLVDWLCSLNDDYTPGIINIPFINGDYKQLKFYKSNIEHPLTVHLYKGKDITEQLYRCVYGNEYHDYFEAHKQLWIFHDWYIKIVRKRKNVLFYSKYIEDIVERFFHSIYQLLFDVELWHTYNLVKWTEIKDELEQFKKAILDPKPYERLLRGSGW